VVLSVGTRTDPSTLVRIPDNFLVRPHVPQLEVLEHTDVFVTHGGMNSVMEAIYYGVPMVVVPQQPEQAMTAARVAELGLGVALEPGQVTAGALRDAVTTISGDAGYRNRLAHTQQAARRGRLPARRRCHPAVRPPASPTRRRGKNPRTKTAIQAAPRYLEGEMRKREGGRGLYVTVWQRAGQGIPAVWEAITMDEGVRRL
jgi:hypothetical protein